MFEVRSACSHAEEFEAEALGCEWNPKEDGRFRV